MMNNNTLLIIPCCKHKQTGGLPRPAGYQDPLSELIDPQSFERIENTRKKLSHVVGEGDETCFLPAIERYVGHFYRAVPNMAEVIRNKTNSANQPRLLILSALYGPLHPESLINIYDLRLHCNTSPWTSQFPVFLERYVRQNGVERIRVYCESDYAEVLRLSSEALVLNGHLSEVVVYEAQGTDVQSMYRNYGRRLVEDLTV